jgi:transcriptional regulator with XRE-family HTH domain
VALGARLKGLRMQAKESLQQVADAIGSSKAHIWEIETGKSKNTGADSLKKLADHFHVSVGYLIGEDPEAADQKSEVVAMFRKLQNLSENDRDIIDAMMTTLIERRAKDKNDQNKQV